MAESKWLQRAPPAWEIPHFYLYLPEAFRMSRLFLTAEAIDFKSLEQIKPVQADFIGSISAPTAFSSVPESATFTI